MTARRSRTVRATPRCLALPRAFGMGRTDGPVCGGDGGGGHLQSLCRVQHLCPARLSGRLAETLRRARSAVVHSGSIPFDEVIRIAKIMRPRSLAKKFEGTVLEILGTAQSVGCQVDGEDPHDIIERIHEGEGPEIPEE